MQTQTADIQLIEKTVGYYFDGMINHNTDSIAKAFHETGTMKWVEDDYKEVNAISALSEYLKANQPVKTKTKILAINVEGNVANARLELEYETFYFIDFMNILKIKGEWKIVSKIYTTKQKAF